MLRRTQCEAAWAASRKKNSYFRALYRRLVGTRGKNRALIAVTHSLPVLDYFDRLNKKNLEKSRVKRLEKPGHWVILEPARVAA